MSAISASAREKIEGAGGTVELLREPKVQKKRRHKAKPVAAEEPEAAEEAKPEGAAEQKPAAAETEETSEETEGSEE